MIKDYQNYLNENQDIISLIKPTEIFDLVDDCLKVMNFICATNAALDYMDKDLLLIFDLGYNYIRTIVETTKIYYTNYFESKKPLFKKYALIIYYILYFEDFYSELEDKTLFDQEKYDSINEKLDNILRNRLSFTPQDIMDIDSEFSIIVQNFSITTKYDIFMLVAEELNV